VASGIKGIYRIGRIERMMISSDKKEMERC